MLSLLCITFDEIDVFIRVYDGTMYLVLFGSEKYDFICNRIRNLIEVIKLKMMTYWKNIILFGTKSMLILKKNLIVSLSIINFFLKNKMKSCGDEVTDFFDKIIPKVDSNRTCLAVISLHSALKNEKLLT